jgi:hypothetical protein
MAFSKNISKKRRSNLAALIAVIVVSALASVPTVVTSLEGGAAPAYGTLHGAGDTAVASAGVSP